MACGSSAVHSALCNALDDSTLDLLRPPGLRRAHAATSFQLPPIPKTPKLPPNPEFVRGADFAYVLPADPLRDSLQEWTKSANFHSINASKALAYARSQADAANSFAMAAANAWSTLQEKQAKLLEIAPHMRRALEDRAVDVFDIGEEPPIPRRIFPRIGFDILLGATLAENLHKMLAMLLFGAKNALAALAKVPSLPSNIIKGLKVAWGPIGVPKLPPLPAVKLPSLSMPSLKLPAALKSFNVDANVGKIALDVGSVGLGALGAVGTVLSLKKLKGLKILEMLQPNLLKVKRRKMGRALGPKSGATLKAKLTGEATKLNLRPIHHTEESLDDGRAISGDSETFKLSPYPHGDLLQSSMCPLLALQTYNELRLQSSSRFPSRSEAVRRFL
eukprot:TRINITY_DN18547_c0_g1_i1.p1 TRINITY_DN18547_c0_g1~~TRINITY_DN18547_c0_g1_i1.p1  ORF type:complete len:390 (-),score=72.47 TRINITY_DN18547_c0_g1_i1:3-1172(-)